MKNRLALEDSMKHEQGFSSLERKIKGHSREKAKTTRGRVLRQHGKLELSGVL